MQKRITEFVGHSFANKAGGINTVSRISHMGKFGHVFAVNCSICSLDREMFTDGEFFATKQTLSRSVCPCGCSGNYRWTQEQTALRVSRSAKERGYEFVEFSEEYSGTKTKVSVRCIKHGVWSSAQAAHFLLGCGCPACGKESSMKDDEYMASTFMATGAFLEGTTFKRFSGKQWEVSCPKCSIDEYADAGFRSSWLSNSDNLQSGRSPCRCTKTYRWSPEERIYQIEKLGYSFLSWGGEYAGNKTKAVIKCDDHGEFSATVQSISAGSGCPGCARYGYDQTKTGFLYFLLSDCHAYMKVGISNKPIQRIAQLKRRTPFGLTEAFILTLDGRKALELEGYAHKSFMSAGLSGFDGATEWMRNDPRLIEHIKERAL